MCEEYQILDDKSTSGKSRPWKDKKVSSIKLADTYSALEFADYSRFSRKAVKVSQCGSFLEFRRYTDNSLKLNHSNFCKDRLCPMCNWRRSLKIFSQVSSIMNVLEDENYEFIFVTLTMRNVCETELPYAIDTLINSYDLLFKRSRIRKSVKGSFRALEVTYNKKSDMFHPHLHLIVAVQKSYFKKDYIKQDEWSVLWKECLSVDYVPVIDVRRIKANGNICKAVAEVSKYAVKDTDYLTNTPDINEKVVFTLDFALSSRRLVSLRGCFLDVAKRLKLDDMEDGDLIHDDDTIRNDLSFVIERYFWNVGISNYAKIE